MAAEKKKSELAEAALLIEMKKSQEAGNALESLGKQKETFEFSRDRFKRLHQQAQERQSLEVVELQQSLQDSNAQAAKLQTPWTL